MLKRLRNYYRVECIVDIVHFSYYSVKCYSSYYVVLIGCNTYLCVTLAYRICYRAI
jgi:hypothetical protein